MRLYFVVCAVVASFFGGMRTRRAALEEYAAQARATADAAAREKVRSDLAVTTVRLQLHMALAQIRLLESREKDREANEKVDFWAGN